MIVALTPLAQHLLIICNQAHGVGLQVLDSVGKLVCAGCIMTNYSARWEDLLHVDYLNEFRGPNFIIHSVLVEYWGVVNQWSMSLAC